MVDKTGKVIFTDLADQESFSKSKIKPDEPMTACAMPGLSHEQGVGVERSAQRKCSQK